MNGVEAELSRTLQVQGAIIYKDAFLGVSLRNFQRDAKNGGFRLAGMDVTGAEEDQKVFAQVKGFDSILIEFERLVVDGADEIFSRCRDGIEDFTRTRQRTRLREHKRSEFLASERTRTIEERAIQIFFKRDLAAVEGGKGEVVAVGKILPIEMESFCGGLARAAVPAVG